MNMALTRLTPNSAQRALESFLSGVAATVGKPLPEPRLNRAQRRSAAKMQRRKQAKVA
jgi:hypothetical protein